MRFSRYLLVVAIGVVASAFTDWLISGVIFHANYGASPEIWRTGMGEGAKIGASIAISVIGVAAFAWLVGREGRPGWHSAMHKGFAVWLAGPVPVLMTDVLWIKLAPAAGAADALEWLLRFAFTGLAAAALL